MQTRKARPSTSKDAEGGFTLVEVLVGMTVLSLLGVVVWGGVTAAVRTVARSHDAALCSARLLQLDDRFRGAVARIRPPWWEPGLVMEESDDAWRIPFFDGEKDKVLVATLKDGTLLIDDGTVATAYAGVSSASLRLEKDDTGAVYGATLEIEGRDIGHLSLFAQLGAFPILERTRR